ncbi:MAG: hypothetical protein SGBAC_006107 [Bacillariaceae sp.]
MNSEPINGTKSLRMFLHAPLLERSLDWKPQTPSRLQSPTAKMTRRLSSSSGALMAMNQEAKSDRTSQRRLSLHTPLSARSLDCMPQTPSRLPSPTAKMTRRLSSSSGALMAMNQKAKSNNTSRRRLSLHTPLSDRSLDCMPQTPTRLPSPTGKMTRRLSNSSTVVMSRRNSASSGMSRRSSFDSSPMVPSRLRSRSPDLKNVRMSVNVNEFLKVFPSPVKESSLHSAVKDMRHSPLGATESSSRGSTTVVPEIDTRAEMLSRMPPHIKQQLPDQEWYRILEPTLLNRPHCTPIDSDISDDCCTLDGSENARTIVSNTSDQIYDELYGSDEEQQVQDKKKPQMEESGMVCGDIYRTAEESKMPASSQDTTGLRVEVPSSDIKPTQTENNTQGRRATTWMDEHLSAYDSLFCTEEESKFESNRSQEPKMRKCACKTPKPLRQKKKVSFGTAQIRWHERILVVHPSTSSGPSVGIGWDYDESEESIDFDHETSAGALRLSRREREAIINELDYATRDIAKAIRETLKIKNQRRRTSTTCRKTLLTSKRWNLWPRMPNGRFESYKRNSASDGKHSSFPPFTNE